MYSYIFYLFYLHIFSPLCITYVLFLLFRYLIMFLHNFPIVYFHCFFFIIIFARAVFIHILFFLLSSFLFLFFFFSFPRVSTSPVISPLMAAFTLASLFIIITYRHYFKSQHSSSEAKSEKKGSGGETIESRMSIFFYP